MATTKTLETDYWPDHKHTVHKDHRLETETRWFVLPAEEAKYDELAPSVGDTDSTNTDLVVWTVDRQDIAGSDSAYAVVLYVEVLRGTVTGGYGETRRVKDGRYHHTDYTVYGVAAAITSSGIPAEGDVLDGATPAGGPFSAICNNVHLDDKEYAGLVLVVSTWRAIRAFA